MTKVPDGTASLNYGTRKGSLVHSVYRDSVTLRLLGRRLEIGHANLVTGL